MSIFASVRRADGTHPSALREMVLEVDKDVEVDFRGFPVCEPRGIRLPRNFLPTLRRVCRKAIVGSGRARWEVAFAQQSPIGVPTRLTAFNMGMENGVRTLSVLSFIAVPVPAVIATTVAITRRGKGLRAVVNVPRIVGGAGSFVAFRLKLRRIFFHRGERKSFLSGRCPDGKFLISSPKTVFRNETRVPGVAAQAMLTGGIVVPCKAKR